MGTPGLMDKTTDLTCLQPLGPFRPLAGAYKTLGEVNDAMVAGLPKCGEGDILAFIGFFPFS